MLTLAPCHITSASEHIHCMLCCVVSRIKTLRCRGFSFVQISIGATILCTVANVGDSRHDDGGGGGVHRPIYNCTAFLFWWCRLLTDDTKHSCNTEIETPPFQMLSLQPRRDFLPLGLVCRDQIFLLQSQANIIQSIEHAVLAESIHLKGDFLTVWAGDSVGCQVNSER